MATITGNEKNRLVTLLNKRGVKIYHACQFKDFKTYLELNGIPSRNLMQKSGLSYTAFDTDDVDKTNGVWHQVFANLSDFGQGFSTGARNENTAPTPNPYGPILFEFSPEILLESNDIAICLRSAGGRNFNRDEESLKSAEEVNKIFKYENVDEAPDSNSKSYIKFSHELKSRYSDPLAMNPELSCMLDSEKFPLTHIERIVVDPYRVNWLNLVVLAQNIGRQFDPYLSIQKRGYKTNRLDIQQEIADFAIDGCTSIPDIACRNDTSDSLRDYISRIQRSRNMEFFFDRFIKYLLHGTLLEMRNENNIDDW